MVYRMLRTGKKANVEFPITMRVTNRIVLERMAKLFFFLSFLLNNYYQNNKNYIRSFTGHTVFEEDNLNKKKSSWLWN